MGKYAEDVSGMNRKSWKSIFRDAKDLFHGILSDEDPLTGIFLGFHTLSRMGKVTHAW
jgi:hypothetical protein